MTLLENPFPFRGDPRVLSCQKNIRASVETSLVSESPLVTESVRWYSVAMPVADHQIHLVDPVHLSCQKVSWLDSPGHNLFFSMECR